MIREADETRRNDPDKDDNKSIENAYREDFMN